MLLVKRMMNFYLQGELTLHKTNDGVKQKFILKGTGEMPLPLEQLVFHAQAKQR